MRPIPAMFQDFAAIHGDRIAVARQRHDKEPGRVAPARAGRRRPVGKVHQIGLGNLQSRFFQRFPHCTAAGRGLDVFQVIAVVGLIDSPTREYPLAPGKAHRTGAAQQ